MVVMKTLWPLTALVSVGLAAVVALFIFAPEGRSVDAPVTAILAMLGSAVTAIYVGRQVGEVRDRVDQVQHTVNGNTAKLIEKIPDPRPSLDSVTERAAGQSSE